jgi:hypothetical protein
VWDAARSKVKPLSGERIDLGGEKLTVGLDLGVPFYARRRRIGTQRASKNKVRPTVSTEEKASNMLVDRAM